MDMETVIQDNDCPKKVSLVELAKLTGFSEELIKKELLLENEEVSEIGLDELRAMMASFLDRSMLLGE